MFDYDFNRLKLCVNELGESNLRCEAEELYRFLQSNSDGKKIYDKIIPLIDKHEYGVGGETARRGYYCPNLYDTFTIGGKNRGRLLNKVRNNSKVSHEYCFTNNCLTVVKQYYDFKKSSLYNIEFILKKDDIEVGIDFDVLDGEIADVFSAYVCQYENGLLKNDRLLVLNGATTGEEETNYIYEKNWYEYDGRSLSTAVHLEYITSIKLFSKEEITFISNENGCPIKFIVDHEQEFVNSITKVNQDYYKKFYLQNESM